jgi:hypothetical protein
MPTNLPPEYFDAEKRYKQAAAREKLAALEELISTVPKHKGTDKLRADMRKRLSQLREEAVKKKRSGKGDLYTVEKQGAAQAALVGFSQFREIFCPENTHQCESRKREGKVSWLIFPEP